MAKFVVNKSKIYKNLFLTKYLFYFKRINQIIIGLKRFLQKTITKSLTNESRT